MFEAGHQARVLGVADRLAPPGVLAPAELRSRLGGLRPLPQRHGNGCGRDGVPGATGVVIGGGANSAVGYSSGVPHDAVTIPWPLGLGSDRGSLLWPR